MLGAKFITQTDASIIDVSWWRLVLCPIHHSSSDTVSLCGSKVTGFTATPFFFCFVCEHSEGPCQGQAPNCWADYHRFTSRTEKKVFPVVFCFVPPVTLRSNVVEVIIQSGLGDDRVMSRTWPTKPHDVWLVYKQKAKSAAKRPFYVEKNSGRQGLMM